jgi:hypothetical protein
MFLPDVPGCTSYKHVRRLATSWPSAPRLSMRRRSLGGMMMRERRRRSLPLQSRQRSLHKQKPLKHMLKRRSATRRQQEHIRQPAAWRTQAHQMRQLRRRTAAAGSHMNRRPHTARVLQLSSNQVPPVVALGAAREAVQRRWSMETRTV